MSWFGHTLLPVVQDIFRNRTWESDPQKAAHVVRKSGCVEMADVVAGMSSEAWASVHADHAVSCVFDRGGDEMNSLNGTISTTKRHHNTLKFEGICSECAHCGHPLTDSVSIERGIGPVCSKKGYKEDPVDADELQAMIDLAEYPNLVEFLVEHHKPQGVRGLMNGLVKICSLNRKHEAFGAMCEAVSSLGYDKLASVLRESIAVVLLSEKDAYPDHYLVWVKRRDFTRAWGSAIRGVKGWRYPQRGTRGILIPKWEKSRQQLWKAMKEHFLGLVVKTPKGCFKIQDRPKKTSVVEAVA